MTAARTIALTPEELRDLLEQAAEKGAERALARVVGKATTVVPAQEAAPVVVTERHMKIAADRMARPRKIRMR